MAPGSLPPWPGSSMTSGGGGPAFGRRCGTRAWRGVGGSRPPWRRAARAGSRKRADDGGAGAEAAQEHAARDRRGGRQWEGSFSTSGSDMYLTY